MSAVPPFDVGLSLRRPRFNHSVVVRNFVVGKVAYFLSEQFGLNLCHYTNASYSYMHHIRFKILDTDSVVKQH